MTVHELPEELPSGLPELEKALAPAGGELPAAEQHGQCVFAMCWQSAHI